VYGERSQSGIYLVFGPRSLDQGYDRARHTQDVGRRSMILFRGLQRNSLWTSQDAFRLIKDLLKRKTWLRSPGSKNGIRIQKEVTGRMDKAAKYWSLVVG